MDEAIAAIEAVMAQQASARAVNQPRSHLMVGPGVYLATMKAAIQEQGVFGYKAYTAASGTYRFHVHLFDASTGELLAIVQGGRLGQLRTGAATAVAARRMAREDASAVGIIGSGYQARTQLEALCKVRPIKAARVFSPSPERRNAFAMEMSGRLGMDVRPVESPRQVVEEGDILVTVTSSPTPVLEGAWLEPGTHVTAVGGAHPYVRELDDSAIQRASLIVVDDREQARIECGELMMPASRGLILWEHVKELWQIVGGSVPGRSRRDDITVFKSLGIALWDVAAAKVVYDSAVARGVGARW